MTTLLWNVVPQTLSLQSPDPSKLLSGTQDSLDSLEQDRRLVEFRELAEGNKYDILRLSKIHNSIINIHGFSRVGFPCANGEIGTTVLIRQGIAFKSDKRLSNLLSNLPGSK
jgi:hypothetical protein